MGGCCETGRNANVGRARNADETTPDGMIALAARSLANAWRVAISGQPPTGRMGGERCSRNALG
eukprot:3890823-Lingulodinium_polyedra.AAC.1